MRTQIKVILFTFLVVASGFAAADSVDIDILQPVQKKPKHGAPAVLPLQPFSGWALTVELTMKDELGIADPSGAPPPRFAEDGSTGIVLFDDPDGCLILTDGWYPSGETCFDEYGNQLITESDESYLEFTPDTDMPGIVDFAGNSDRQAALVDAGTPMPGPPTGGDVADGYGYGADDDVPGLVIVADHGTGIVYDDNGIALPQRTLKNLAGFLTSVNYELNNVKGRTAITAQLHVPSFLFAPVVIADEEYTPPDSFLPPDIYWRVDGATEILPAASFIGEPPTDTHHDYPKLVAATTYTVSAMVVNGVAPDVVVDMNHDKLIDETDIEMMGYAILGDMRSVTFRMFPGVACFGGSGLNTIYADLDGSGNGPPGLVCPAGPGSVSEVPR